MEFLNTQKLGTYPLTRSLNNCGLVGPDSMNDMKNSNTAAFVSAKNVLKDEVSFKTSTKHRKLPNKPDMTVSRDLVVDFALPKSLHYSLKGIRKKKLHENDYERIINAVPADKNINWRRTGNSFAAFREAKMLSMRHFMDCSNHRSLLYSSASEQSISANKLENKSARCYDSVNTPYAGSKKCAGKQKTIKRGGVRMHLNEFGQEILGLGGSWLSEQFRLAALEGSWGTQKLICRLTEMVLKSLKSLYMDGIKPWLGDVAHRLRPSFQHLLTLAEVKGLAEMCGDKVLLVHEMRCKGEEGCVVYLTEEPEGYQGFVDIHNADDSFTQHEWQLFYGHMINLMQNDAVTTEDKPYEFRGGRYAFAELMQRNVEEFKKKRLGELCHMVQLSIHYGALTYVNCVLQPSSACYAKTQAITQVTHNPIDTRHPVCKSIEEVMQIATLLTGHHPEGLVLAQLKQKFQREFNRDLDPEVFGYMKLQHLFLHRPLSSIYRLYTPRNSPHRTIVQHIQYPLPDGAVLFKIETVKETKLDQLITAMSPICYTSNVSCAFLKRSSLWSFKVDVDDDSWNKYFAAKQEEESRKDYDSCANSSASALKFTLHDNNWNQETKRLFNSEQESIEYKQSLNQEDFDRRVMDDTASLDDLRSVSSSATTDTSSVTPTNYTAPLSPSSWKCRNQAPNIDSFRKISVSEIVFNTNKQKISSFKDA